MRPNSSVGINGLMVHAIRQVCEDHVKVSQNVLAKAARESGLAWSAATVANIATGQRRLSVDEIVLLPLIIWRAVAEADGERVELSLAELLKMGERHAASNPNHDVVSAGSPTGVQVAMGEYPLADLIDIVQGRVEKAIDRQNDEYLESDVSFGIVGPAPDVRKWWPQATDADVFSVRSATLDEAERKAAVSLRKAMGSDVRAIDVSAIAHKLWGTSLTKHRDEEYGKRNQGAASRDSRAARGHITRTLVAAIREEFENGKVQ